MQRRMVAIAAAAAVSAAALSAPMAAQDTPQLEVWTLQQAEGPIKEAAASQRT